MHKKSVIENLYNTLKMQYKFYNSGPFYALISGIKAAVYCEDF